MFISQSVKLISDTTGVKLYIFIHNEVRDFDKNSTQPNSRQWESTVCVSRLLVQTTRFVFPTIISTQKNSSTFFRFFMTKNLIFLIKFDIKIMEACAKEIILKCSNWYFYGKQPQYPYINEVIITVCVKTAIFSIEKINFLYSIKISDNSRNWYNFNDCRIL
jgi:hypothetical protein